MGQPVYVEGAIHTTYERKGSSVTDTIITLYNVPRELDTEFKN